MARGQPVNDNQRPARTATGGFDYSAPAEVFILRTRSSRGTLAGYRRFPTAAEAIHFAIEEVPGPFFVGVVMEVREERFDHKAIRELYSRDEYPSRR